MIVDKLENIGKYASVLKDADKLSAFFASNPTLVEGTTVEVPDTSYEFGPFRFESELSEEKRWEIHHTQNDIHIAVKGREVVGWIPVDLLSESVGYTEDIDCEFFTDDIVGSDILLEEGWFLLVEPKDAHKPSVKALGVDGGVKIVIKADVL
jgi:YhcH/YjgK/YiaL family protein